MSNDAPRDIPTAPLPLHLDRMAPPRRRDTQDLAPGGRAFALAVTAPITQDAARPPRKLRGVIFVGWRQGSRELVASTTVLPSKAVDSAASSASAGDCIGRPIARSKIDQPRIAPGHDLVVTRAILHKNARGPWREAAVI